MLTQTELNDLCLEQARLHRQVFLRQKGSWPPQAGFLMPQGLTLVLLVGEPVHGQALASVLETLLRRQEKGTPKAIFLLMDTYVKIMNKEQVERHVPGSLSGNDPEVTEALVTVARSGNHLAVCSQPYHRHGQRIIFQDDTPRLRSDEGEWTINVIPDVWRIPA